MTAERDDPAPELDHEAALRAVLDQGRPQAVAHQHARGKQTARERVAQLVDAGTFREIGALARPDRAAGEPDVPADAIVTGTALIDDRPVVVIATDCTAAGGSNGLVGNDKQKRVWELAAGRGIPVVMLFDGGGHRIQEGLDARIFAGGFDLQQMQTRLSGWVPMVAAMLGPGYGQPTLTGSLCDYVVAVRGLATLGMAPPALVRMATGESVEDLGLGEPDAQAVSGTVDLVVDSEDEALDAVRLYLALMPANAEEDPPRYQPAEPSARHADRLDSVVPANLRQGYDMHDVIAGLIDEGSDVELKSGYAQNIITTVARIAGHPIGIIANQPAVQAGVLDAGGAEKAAHLLSLCDAFAIPVLTLMDLPGLAIGSAAEHSGLARKSARLALEYGSVTVPTFSVIVRKGYGGGYVIMSGGRTFHPELVLAWPAAETAVMSVDTAIAMVYRREVQAAPDPDRRRAELSAQFQGRLGAVRAAEGFGVDDVCRPSETRDLLADVLGQVPRRRLMQTLTPRRHPVIPL